MSGQIVRRGMVLKQAIPEGIALELRDLMLGDKRLPAIGYARNQFVLQTIGPENGTEYQDDQSDKNRDASNNAPF